MKLIDLGLQKAEIHIRDNAGLFSNGKLVAVFTKGGMFRAQDLYRQPDNSQRHLNEWAHDRGVTYEDIEAVSCNTLTQLLLGIHS